MSSKTRRKDDKDSLIISFAADGEDQVTRYGYMVPGSITSFVEAPDDLARRSRLLTVIFNGSEASGDVVAEVFALDPEHYTDMGTGYVFTAGELSPHNHHAYITAGGSFEHHIITPAQQTGRLVLQHVVKS